MRNKIMSFETFKNEEVGQIRIAFLNDEPIFNLYDVCWNLGYVRTNNEGNIYLRKDRIVNICQTFEITGVTATVTNEITGVDTVSTNKIQINKDTDFENTWINEEAFYDLCLESKAKNARAFRKWVTGEVLTSIRKTGSYSLNESKELYTTYNKTTTSAEDIKIVDTALITVLKEMAEAKTTVECKLKTIREFYSKIGIDIPLTLDMSFEENWLTVTELAQACGLYSKNGRVATDALTYVLKLIDIKEDEKKITYIEDKGWKGDTIKYKESVLGKIAAWFVARGFPTIIEGGNREYEIMYKSMKTIRGV